MEFPHTLTIERPFGVDADSDTTVDVDDYGQPVREYEASFATVQALVQPKTAREIALVSEAGAEISDHTIYMHRRDLAASDRLRDDAGRVYEIVGIRDYDFGSLAHFAVDAKRIGSPDVELGS